MARARNIKPGLYKNEDLAECSIWARYIFPGLWMLADREGRLEDRPKRIKGELLPYDSVEVEPLLAELAENGFIRRYEVRGERFIYVVKFLEHQAPHGTERDGVCPDEDGYLTVHERGKNGYTTGNFALHPYGLTVKEHASNSDLTVNGGSSSGGENTLIPDSLIPDSLIPDSGLPKREKAVRAPRFDAQAHLESLGVESAVARDWLILRSGKKLKPTETAFAGVLRETEKAGISMNEALIVCCTRGWGGFEASWLARGGEVKGKGPVMQKQSRHGGFDKIDYREGIADDGSF